VAVFEAIPTGDQEGLRRLLEDHPGLATPRIGDDGPGGTTRSLLHVATDWPGHFPGGPATAALLVAAGVEVDARFGGGSHDETPLHWAASSDDAEVLDALLDRLEGYFTGPARHPGRSTGPSGVPATAGSTPAPSTCWSGAPTPTGSRPGSR
jgi:hypothetical protein